MLPSLQLAVELKLKWSPVVQHLLVVPPQYPSPLMQVQAASLVSGLFIHVPELQNNPERQVSEGYAVLDHTQELEELAQAVLPPSHVTPTAHLELL